MQEKANGAMNENMNEGFAKSAPDAHSPVSMRPTDGAGLRRGALRLPAVLMQGIGHTAPATAILLTLPITVTYAGVAAPLAYLLAFAVVLMLGIGLTQLARHLPSAGGYYTYVSRTVHPRAGFLTAWLFFLYSPVAPAFSLAIMGYVLESSLKAEYGVVFPWWLFLLLRRPGLGVHFVSASYTQPRWYCPILDSRKFLLPFGFHWNESDTLTEVVY
jgi:amino acid transporter